MDSFKSFIRKYWPWIAGILSLLAVFTWSSSGDLLSGVIVCAVTAFINWRLLRWLLPEHADVFTSRERWDIKLALPYVIGALLIFMLCRTRTGTGSGITISIASLICIASLAASECFLILGPVLQLMMNRYAQDDVGVFQACLFSGACYGIVYLLYGVVYVINLESVSLFSVLTQSAYIVLITMFLCALYLVTENFLFVLIVRVIGLLLERGTEIISTTPVSLYTLVGFRINDSLIILIFAVVVGVFGLNYASDVPPWSNGEFRPRKRQNAMPKPMQDPHLEAHNESVISKLFSRKSGKK